MCGFGRGYCWLMLLVLSYIVESKVICQTQIGNALAKVWRGYRRSEILISRSRWSGKNNSVGFVDNVKTKISNGVKNQ